MTVYTARDEAKPGYAPAPVLERKSFLRYEEQRLGVTRFYTARQASIDIDRVLRVPAGGPSISPQDVVRTEDGKFYRVDMVQTVQGTYPPSLDLTLYRFDWKGDSDGQMDGSA